MFHAEQSKYQEVWQSQAYRDACNAKASRRLPQLIAHFKSVGAHRLIDLGVGTGRTAKLLVDAGFDVEGLDIAPNSLEEDIPTVCMPLWDAGKVGRYDGVICIDVLEHIPECYVDRCLLNIEMLAPHGYLVIALRKERMNFGQPLHLTVEPASWWAERIRFATVGANLTGTHAIARY